MLVRISSVRLVGTYAAVGPMTIARDHGRSVCGRGRSGTNDQEHSRTMEGDMAKLIYSAIASLDGYVEDEQGKFDWAAPGDEVHALVNELERPIGTHLYGRRMYETMVFWETVSTGDQRAVSREFAEIWRAADKIVYSRTLQTLSSARTRIEHDFDPRRDRTAQAVLGPRHLGRRCRARRRGDRRRLGRRVPPIPDPDHRGWRKARTARQRPRPARAVSRTPLPKRRRSSPLRDARLTGPCRVVRGQHVAGPG